MSQNRNISFGRFQWDSNKEKHNVEVHKISFSQAIDVFLDPKRIIATDEKHGEIEERYFCIGIVENKIVTVRFTYRGRIIRIIGAGFWRKGKKLYETSKQKKK